MSNDTGSQRPFRNTNRSPLCRDVVVSQNLLPHLWRLGVLGGQSLDVPLERWPMEELQHQLDLAKSTQPQSTTLGDFRANEDLQNAEQEALAAAGRLVTPHLAIAAHFGKRAWLIPWEMPAPIHDYHLAGKPTLFLPASRLGRKDAFELADALKSGINTDLLLLETADERTSNPLVGLDCHRGKPTNLASASALVLPTRNNSP